MPDLGVVFTEMAWLDDLGVGWHLETVYFKPYGYRRVAGSNSTERSWAKRRCLRENGAA
jgi:hypothetical protein